MAIEDIGSVQQVTADIYGVAAPRQVDVNLHIAAESRVMTQDRFGWAPLRS